MGVEYYPPPDILECVKFHPADYQRIIMPFFDTYRFDPPAYSSGTWQEAPAQQLPPTSSNPQAYPPPQTSSMQHSSTVGQSGLSQGLQTNPHTGSVHAGSGQCNGESWVEFEARMERGLEAQKTIESREEWQRREAQETYTQKHGYSKKSSVYIWEEDDANPTFYCRALLSKVEVEVNWENFTAHQCQFWSHKMQWDLCPQISPFGSKESSQAEQARIADLDNSEDEDFSLLYSKPSTQRNKKLAEAMLESVQAAVARDAEAPDSPHEVHTLDMVDYLQKRHGFYPRHHESVRATAEPNLIGF